MSQVMRIGESRGAAASLSLSDGCVPCADSAGNAGMSSALTKVTAGNASGALALGSGLPRAMVGRFECAELRREALKREEVFTNRGQFGICPAWCWLLVVAVVLVLASAPSVFFDTSPSPPPASGDIAEATSSRQGLDVSEWSTSTSPRDLPSDIYGLYGIGGRGSGISVGASAEVPALKVDFSLIALTLAVLAFLISPSLFKALVSGDGTTRWPSDDYASAATQFGGGSGGYSPSCGGLLGGGLLGPVHPYGARGAAGAAVGPTRVVDVRPGELRWRGDVAGSGLSPAFGMGASRPGLSSMGSTGTGSWSSRVPSPYSTGASAGGLGTLGTFGTLGPSAAALGVVGAADTSGAGISSFTPSSSLAVGLPSEAEVADTYANFAVLLQQVVPAFADLLDKQVIDPLLREVDASDQLWRQVLQQRGWRLTFEAPHHGSGRPGIGPAAQELSIFDRHLPRPLSDDPSMIELWGRRQQLESFLTHPSFAPSQRQCVLERLREWRQRGFANAMRFESRSCSTMPTDAHILENLVVKMLQIHLDFAGCFLAYGHAPPLSKHLGQSPTAYLRQVTSQTQPHLPRPAPHYEVVTLAKVWRLRPGNTNILEALALLCHTLKRQSPRSYQAFPQNLRNAFEISSNAGAPGVGGLWQVASNVGGGGMGGMVGGLFGSSGQGTASAGSGLFNRFGTGLFGGTSLFGGGGPALFGGGGMGLFGSGGGTGLFGGGVGTGLFGGGTGLVGRGGIGTGIFGGSVGF